MSAFDVLSFIVPAFDVSAAILRVCVSSVGVHRVGVNHAGVNNRAIALHVSVLLHVGALGRCPVPICEHVHNAKNLLVGVHQERNSCCRKFVLIL